MPNRDMPDDAPDQIEEEIRARLECLGTRGRPFAIFDPASIDEAGRDEVCELARLLSPDEFVLLAVPAALLPTLLPFLTPDHREMFRAGRPLVIAPIAVEEREANAAHRPHDTQPVKVAKAALEMQAFRLVTAQKAAELARNYRARLLTAAEANERAKDVIGEAVWREGSDPEGNRRIDRVEGLIDRGRRLAAEFFGVAKPRDIGKAEAEHVADRVGTSLPGSAERAKLTAALERDHREQARALADHEIRARAHEGAMGRWSASVRDGRSIEVADGLDVTNGIATRQSAPTLMRVALGGELNPAEVHRNLETMREVFQVGMLIGRLSRRQPIELTPGQAKILIQSLDVFVSQLHGSGRPETEADGCAWYLAHAALNCHDLGLWNETIARILETGKAETVVPEAL